MPHFDIIRKAQPSKSFRVAAVMGTFDLDTNQVEEHFVGNIDLPKDWQIGLIVGNSGTGKTTIAKELFPDAYITTFQYNGECVLDDMPKGKSIEEITKAFSNVGFSSVPSWLKPYSVLSNGEKMRVDLARAILEDNELFVFDEFTSVVDRNIAKIGSFATQKAIRKTSKKFIAVSCHFDIENWLLPDWVFDTNTMTFRLCEEQKKNRPICKLDVYETKEKENYWRIFRKYHYLSHTHNNAARVFVATMNDDLCAFLSVLPFPHAKKKDFWRAHRIVVLPDFQGLQIGLRLTKFVCNTLAKENKHFFLVTSNAAFIASLKRDKDFRCTRIGRVALGNGIIHNSRCKQNSSVSRITCSFEFVG